MHRKDFGRVPKWSRCGSRGDALKIGAHHVRHAVDDGVAPSVVHRDLAALHAIAQCFERDIEADLVAVLEAIGDGFGGIEHRHADAVDQYLLNAFGERGAEDAQLADGGLLDARRGRVARGLVDRRNDCAAQRDRGRLKRAEPVAVRQAAAHDPHIHVAGARLCVLGKEP